MKKEIGNDVKLGLFVLSSILFLILLLYMIGKNKNFFGSNLKIRSRFENVQGLKAGNNVRFAGINIGTVDVVNIIDDTTLEVSMNIEDKMKDIIKANSIVSIGTDGLVGNKVINIQAVKERERHIEQNELLPSRRAIDTDEMLKTLNKTNKDIGIIAENLKNTTNKINNSHVIWDLLSDKSIPKKIHASLENINQSSNKIKTLLNHSNEIVEHVMSGNGSIGLLLYDTIMRANLFTTIENFRILGKHANEISKQISYTLDSFNNDLHNSKGTIHALLNDSLLTHKIHTSVDNIDRSSSGLNEIIDAIKQSFLFRAYFRKIEEKKTRGLK